MDINYVYKHACRVDWSHATEMHHHSGNTVTQHKFVYYHKYRERGVCRERHHSLISDLWLGHTINSIYGNKGQAGINTIFVGGNAELLIATQPQEQSYTLKLGKPSIVCNWTHTHTHTLSPSLSLSLSLLLASLTLICWSPQTSIPFLHQNLIANSSSQNSSSFTTIHGKIQGSYA